jgi:glycyl-tRNA synthetase beta chain
MDYPPALRALRRLRTDDSDAFSSLAASDKRARNIIGKATGLDVRQPAEADALPTENERALLKLVRELDREVRALIDSESGAGTNREQVFAHALRATVRIAPPVAAFFDHVMVNVDDQTLRVNRLRLLNEVTGLTGRVADLSRLAA